MSEGDAGARRSWTFRGSRVKVAWYFVGSAAFTAAGIAMLLNGSAVGWLAAVFFGLCVVGSAAQLITGPIVLTLTPTCLVVRRVWERSFELRRCGEFRLWGGPSRRALLITFDYARPGVASGALASVNHMLGAGTCSIPVRLLPGDPEALVELLNSYRSAALRDQTPERGR